MNWIRSANKSVALTDEAVRDFAGILTYFQLGCELTARSSRENVYPEDREMAEGMAMHYEKMASAINWIGGNLRQRFDIFRLELSMRIVEERMALLTDRNPKKLIASPSELIRVYAIAERSQGAGDDPGDGDGVGAAAGQDVSSGGTGPGYAPSPKQGSEPHEPRPGDRKGLDRRNGGVRKGRNKDH